MNRQQNNSGWAYRPVSLMRQHPDNLRRAEFIGTANKLLEHREGR